MSATRRPTHCERVLELLQDGRAHSHHELYELRVVVHSRITELRQRGYSIDIECVGGSDGNTYWYRLLGEPVPADQRSVTLRRPAPRGAHESLVGTDENALPLPSEERQLLMDAAGNNCEPALAAAGSLHSPSTTAEAREETGQSMPPGPSVQLSLEEAA